MSWDTIQGSYTDTAIYQFHYDRQNKSLALMSLVQPSDNRHISFYFFRNRLIAARIISDIDFPSWSNKLVYFNDPYKYNKDVIVREVDSEKEKDVRNSLLLEAYSTLEYFNSKKKNLVR